jgi:uncharacterized protein YaaR (DUF327 family)
MSSYKIIASREVQTEVWDELSNTVSMQDGIEVEVTFTTTDGYTETQKYRFATTDVEEVKTKLAALTTEFETKVSAMEAGESVDEIAGLEAGTSEVV